MTHKETALKYFNDSFHCSQSVLAAYADECNLTIEQALKLGACFGSGMRKAEMCGACSGALMVLGAMYGQYDKDDLDSRRIANEVNDVMVNRFEEVCGSYNCRDLLGCDISTPDGVTYAREKRLFTNFCPHMVEHAVDILEEIIAEQNAKG